jgi:LacI family gluconate utilization system Gnt-I transcriptional repressor
MSRRLPASPSSKTRQADEQGQSPRPTMEDVAREAGVGRMTVSRALNQPEMLSPETLTAVRAAIERLRYVPNLNAGSLASSRSRIIGAVIPTIENTFFSDTISGLSQSLAAKGYQLLLGQTLYQPREEAALIDAFLGRRVDGLMLIRTSNSDEAHARVERSGIPVVEAWDMPSQQIDMLVGFSNNEAGAAAARYLAAKGHKHLGYIGSRETRSSSRLAGFRAAARECGLPAIESVILRTPAKVSDAGHTLTTLLERSPKLDAVFCSSDMLAAGVLFECQRRGIAVPDRLAVMGFADLPIAAETFPALTTVRVPSHEIGKRAGEMLLARLHNEKDVITRVDLGFEVIERGSA